MSATVKTKDIEGLYEPGCYERAAGTEIGDRLNYEHRMGVKAQHITTICSPENTRWMMRKMLRRIRGKVVVEIGAGHGILAIEMAKVAKRVFAIESDPMWTYDFVQVLYKTKPANLTWIFDTAENVLEAGLGSAMNAGVAVVVTGSDETNLRKLAEQFVLEAEDVIMPWQDWTNGVVIIDYQGGTKPPRNMCQTLATLLDEPR